MDCLTLGSDLEDVIPVAIIAGGGVVIGIVAILTTAIKSVLQTRHTEESRSEIAAYIAEGSMTVEQGERLMRAGPSASSESKRGCMNSAEAHA